MAQRHTTDSVFAREQELDLREMARLLVAVLGTVVGLAIAFSAVGGAAVGFGAALTAAGLVGGLAVGTVAVWEAGFRAARWADDR